MDPPTFVYPMLFYARETTHGRCKMASDRSTFCIITASWSRGVAKQRTIAVAALNVRIHPHSKDLYVQLFKDAFALRRPIQVYGSTHMLISSLKDDQENNEIAGTLAKFTVIDENLTWFNYDKFDEASEDDLKKIQIPENLRPNFSSHFFEFFPSKHLVVFEARGAFGTLSVKAVHIFFSALFSQAEITQKYGSVSVSLIAARDELTKIIDGEGIRRVTIELMRPNPDDQGDYDKEITEKLLEMGAQKLTVKLDADASGNIKVEGEYRKMAALAMSNGVVSSERKLGERPRVKASSADHPQQEQIKYDPDVSTEQAVFRRAADSLARRAVIGLQSR